MHYRTGFERQGLLSAACPCAMSRRVGPSCVQYAPLPDPGCRMRAHLELGVLQQNNGSRLQSPAERCYEQPRLLTGRDPTPPSCPNRFSVASCVLSIFFCSQTTAVRRTTPGGVTVLRQGRTGERRNRNRLKSGMAKCGANKSVPSYAVVFEGPKPLFAVACLALLACTFPLCPTASRK